MADASCDIGLVGLGVMGRNLAMNIADHGFSVAGFDKDNQQVRALRTEAGGSRVRVVGSIGELVGSLKSPRAAFLMVPAGNIIDQVIDELAPKLAAGDIIIDGGNSHFSDTDRRGKDLASRGLRFLGIGVSGGAEGARRGPSIMPGGPREAYDAVKDILEAVAAKVDDEPCVAWLGPGSAGHYVKMVHNGIEYALMQLLAEGYNLLSRGLGFDNDRLHEVYRCWNQGPVRSYLVEITSAIFLQQDERSGARLVDMILDEASQKGTGAWTSKDALELRTPVPTIDAAVTARNLSDRRRERAAVGQSLAVPTKTFSGSADELAGRLERAMLAAMVVAYDQGLCQLRAASAQYGYGLALDLVARIWRGGCIIRSALLEGIRAAYRRDGELVSLLADPRLAATVGERLDDLRTVVAAMVSLGIPCPAFAASLGYIDSLRSPRLPANLIQAQRDFFGSHAYRRIDAEGSFHTDWRKE